MASVVYLNGEFVDREQAAVSVADKGLLHGAGLFETMIARSGGLWRVAAHLRRLRQSAEALHLPLPSGLDRLDGVALELLQRNRLSDARLRLTLTAGPDPQADSDGPRPTLLLTAGEHRPYPGQLYARGMTVLIAGQHQDPSSPLTGHKTLCYLPRLLALREAQQKACQEALFFTPDRRLAEGCVSNVFLAKDGVLLTPPASTPVLAGITRQAVLELAGSLSIVTEQKPLSVNDLLEADEVFLTSVGLGVMPVCRIERHRVVDEQPGPIAARISEALARLIEDETRG